MKMLNLFSKKTVSLDDLRQQRATVDEQLDAAEVTAIDKRTACSDVAAGLAPGSLDEVEAAARAAEDRAGSLKAALHKLDGQIAAAEAATLAAGAKTRRDDAVAKLHAWRDETIEVRRALVPLVNRLRELSMIYDGTLEEYGRGRLQGMLGDYNAVLLGAEVAKEGFNGLADVIARNDIDSDKLAVRTLTHKPQPLPSVE